MKLESEKERGKKFKIQRGAEVGQGAVYLLSVGILSIFVDNSLKELFLFLNVHMGSSKCSLKSRVIMG